MEGPGTAGVDGPMGVGARLKVLEARVTVEALSLGGDDGRGLSRGWGCERLGAWTRFIVGEGGLGGEATNGDPGVVGVFKPTSFGSTPDDTV